jgi:MFS transporter, AAHS family, 4-hydroxybenzoate transporter
MTGMAEPQQESLVDELKIDGIGGLQTAILVLGALVLFCDGFDAQMMSFVAPALARDWNLGPNMLGPVFAANLSGLMLGAAICAPIADVSSRRRMVLFNVAAFGLATLAVLFVHSVTMLIVLRLITGLSMGAAMPTMIALTSEFIPRRLRTRLVVALSCSFSFGTTICGAVASLVIQDYGWSAMFWIGGILPLATCVALAAFLPESPRFLAVRQAYDDLARLVRRLAPGVTFDLHRPQSPIVASHFPVKELFTDGRASLTLLIWLTFFLYGSSLYFLINWLPTLVTKSGFSITEGGAVTAVYQFGGLLGGFLIGYLVDRFGFQMLVASTFVACVVVALTGFAAASLSAIFVAAFAAGVFVIGNQHTVNALVGAVLYPNSLRATGLGWALGSVRLGGVLAGSLGAGLLLKANLSIEATFLIIALGELGAALALIVLYRVRFQERRPKDLEDERPIGSTNPA